MVYSPAFSIAIKPKMEALGAMVSIGESFDPGAMAKPREDVNASNSGYDNMEVARGDECENSRSESSKKKKYHRHTYQLQQLEALFKENPHPDEKQRLALGRKLNLEHKQIKFWFQNRRTQMKAQLERHENLFLKKENDKLRIENMAIKEAMRNPICGGCGGEVMLEHMSVEHLRIENAQLKDELNRARALVSKIRPLSSSDGFLPSPMLNSILELDVGKNSFGSSGNVCSTSPIGLDLNNAVSNALHVVPLGGQLIAMPNVNYPSAKSMFFELALAASFELIKLAHSNTPLWLRSSEGSGETLNVEEYRRMITPCIDIKPSGLFTEGTRASCILNISSRTLVEVLMDTYGWSEMFADMIGSSSTLEVIASGMDGTSDGALQLMHAEIQVISPLVPVRQVRFLRFCKKHVDGVWIVADMSVDTIHEGGSAQISVNCRRLPSGCVVQDMPNGYSKITWVEHCEYDESAIHHLYRPLITSGIGFGAQRWLANLQKQCELLDAVMSFTALGEDQSVVTPKGARSMAKLAQRMTRIFCSGVCATVNKWDVVQVGNMDEDARLLVRRGIPNRGEPSEVVLSTTMSVRMPVQPQQLFDLLQNEQRRSEWDVLSHGGPTRQIIRIAKGQDCGKSISLLQPSATDAGDTNQKLILQETSNDMLGSLIVSAAVDMSSMNMVLNGGSSTFVPLLPSGFAIVPDCFPKSGGPGSFSGMVSKEHSNPGSLLTVGFQILLTNLPTASLTEESVNTVNSLMSRTIQGIKDALHCN